MSTLQKYVASSNADLRAEAVLNALQNKILKKDKPTEKDIIMLLVKENNELKTFMSKQHALMLKVIEKDAKFSDQYNKIIIENMGGQGDNDLEK